MPANRKRQDLRQDNRPSRKPKLEVVKADTKPDLLGVAKRNWLAATKKDWNAYRESGVAQALEAADIAVVRRLFEFRDLALAALKRYQEEPYVSGSKGQPITNPAFDEAMTLERQAVALEDRLGLSPKARAALGIEFGRAKLTAEELNRMAREGRTNADGEELQEAEIIAEGWEEAN